MATPVNTAIASDLSYSYGWGEGVADNGDLSALNNVNSTMYSKSFYYDAYNRISEYKTPNSTLWDVQYTIDPWGNLSAKTPKSGYGGESLLTGPVSNANQLNGYGYDANGNMTTGDGNSYAYDSENRITGAAGEHYTYDGDGQRVQD